MVQIIQIILLTEDIAKSVVDKLESDEKDKYKITENSYWIEDYDLNLGNYMSNIITTNV